LRPLCGLLPVAGWHAHDAAGRRIRKLLGTNPAEPALALDYYHNNAGQIIEVHKDEDDDHPLEQYVWSPRYVHAPVLRWRDENTDGENLETLYYCNDANMNVTALVDTSGAVVERYLYDPYGKVTVCEDDWTPREGNASAYSNEILFTGHRLDPESGLYITLHRHYHPTLGRWMQRDPKGYVDGMSLYEYCHSEPTCARDPQGLRYFILMDASKVRESPNNYIKLDDGTTMKYKDYVDGHVKSHNKAVDDRIRSVKSSPENTKFNLNGKMVSRQEMVRALENERAFYHEVSSGKDKAKKEIRDYLEKQGAGSADEVVYETHTNIRVLDKNKPRARGNVEVLSHSLGDEDVALKDTAKEFGGLLAGKNQPKLVVGACYMTDKEIKTIAAVKGGGVAGSDDEGHAVVPILTQPRFEEQQPHTRYAFTYGVYELQDYKH